MVWKKRYLFIDIFAWTWNIWGGRTENKIHQNRKKGSFCEELLRENDYEAVLANFCWYEFGVSASEAVQKISTRTLEWYANSLKHLISLDFIATYEKTYLAVYYLLIGDTSQVSVFFSWQIKMNNLLHVGLILLISKVFTILCLICLCRNREYRGNFQTKQ